MSNLMNTVIASWCLVGSLQAKQLSWSPADMMNMQTISDVQISPNNESVLFVAKEAVMSEEKSAYISRIFKSQTNGKGGLLTFSVGDGSVMQPRWSPDGKWIAFLSDHDGTKNLCLVRYEGEEVIPLTKGGKPVLTFAWSPDNRHIAFVRAEEINKDQKSSAFQYKENTAINRLWIIDPFSEDPTPRALTTDAYCARGEGEYGTTNIEFDWSPDAKHIVFAHSPALGFDYYHLDSSLAIINLSTGTINPLEKKAPFEALPRFSPDGRWIAYLSDDTSQRYAGNNQIALRSVENGERKVLASTFNEGAFMFGPSLLGWTHDGKSVLFFEPKRTKYHITLLPADGGPVQDLETDDWFIKEPVLSQDRSMIGFVAQSTDMPPEAYVSKLHAFQPVQISQLNKSFLTFPKPKTEIITWESSDGLKIEGLLTYPFDYQKGERYPLMLNIHGGPSAFFDETFVGAPSYYPVASFSEAGFFVFRPNPRGSCGYGKTFRCANYFDWGGMDFKDIMTGVDVLIARGIADPERLGVMGWSYGGYMTAWTITQTSRFKAASVGAAPCNLISMTGTTDLHRFMGDYLGEFTKNRELYAKRSPINYIEHAKTPCLIQHGVEDKRVPVSQAFELYHALDRLAQQPILVLYPGMEHRITDPKMFLDAMERNLAWFQEHLSREQCSEIIKEASH